VVEAHERTSCGISEKKKQAGRKAACSALAAAKAKEVTENKASCGFDLLPTFADLLHA
jgi:hypothetical protein